MRTHFLSFLILGLAFLTLAGCKTSSSTFTSLKALDAPQSKYEKVLVVAISENGPVRRYYEDHLATHIRHHGAEAMPSLDVISVEEKVSKETFQKYFSDMGFDAVVVTRLMEVKNLPDYEPNDPGAVPVNYYNYYSYYDQAYQREHAPGNFVNGAIIRLETNVYDVASGGKLVWTGQSKSYQHGKQEQTLNEVGKLIAAELKKEGYL